MNNILNYFFRYTEKEKREGRREDELLNVKSANNGGAAGGNNGGANKPDRNNLAASASNNSPGASDVEKEAGKLASLPPAKIALPKDVKVVQISTGLHHTLLLTNSGDVFSFGSNSHGQLGLHDSLSLVPRGVPTKVLLPDKIAAISAGSYHSAVMTVAGEVLTFGSHSKGQLGRDPPDAKPKDPT